MVSGLGSLVKPCCGEEGALQTNVTAVCGEHLQGSGHTGSAPLTGVAFPVSTAQAPGCCIWSVPCVACVLHKSSDSVAPAFCAFPGRAAQAARSLTGALSPVRRAFSPLRSQPQFPPAPVGCMCLVSVLGSWPLAATLPADVDHAESPEAFG